MTNEDFSKPKPTTPLYVFKLTTNQGENRRLSTEKRPSLAEFHEIVKSATQIKVAALYYKDDEGDMVTVRSEQEWDEALRLLASQPVLKFNVDVKPKKTEQPQPTKNVEKEVVPQAKIGNIPSIGCGGFKNRPAMKQCLKKQQQQLNPVLLNCAAVSAINAQRCPAAPNQQQQPKAKEIVAPKKAGAAGGWVPQPYDSIEAVSIKILRKKGARLLIKAEKIARKFKLDQAKASKKINKKNANVNVPTNENKLNRNKKLKCKIQRSIVCFSELLRRDANDAEAEFNLACALALKSELIPFADFFNLYNGAQQNQANLADVDEETSKQLRVKTQNQLTKRAKNHFKNAAEKGYKVHVENSSSSSDGNSTDEETIRQEPRAQLFETLKASEKFSTCF